MLTSIGYLAKARKELRRQPPMVPRRPPRHAAGLPRRVKGASRCALTADPVPDRKQPDVGSIETAAVLTFYRWRR